VEVERRFPLSIEPYISISKPLHFSLLDKEGELGRTNDALKSIVSRVFSFFYLYYEYDFTVQFFILLVGSANAQASKYGVV
jgi:hypothetical protein